MVTVSHQRESRDFPMKIRRRLMHCVLWGSVVVLVNACDKPPEMAANSNATSPNIADADVTTNVHTALHRDPALKNFVIDVVTLKGDVRLIGTLDTQAQIDSVAALARASNGVHSVHNELTLRK
jgi:osmotically-inducible protein OsmY